MISHRFASHTGLDSVCSYILGLFFAVSAVLVPDCYLVTDEQSFIFSDYVYYDIRIYEEVGQILTSLHH